MAFKPLSWLAGQTDFHADAPGTGAGQKAIRAQMNAASGRGQAQAYGMAASARGGSSPLALREAQRQAAFANQSAAQQGAIASGQLEQQRLQNIMQQQEINARIAQGNAGGILKLAGVAAGGAALAMSDERTKSTLGGIGSLLGGSDDGSDIASTLSAARKQREESDRRAQVRSVPIAQQAQPTNPFAPVSHQGSTSEQLMQSGRYGSATVGGDDGRRVQWVPSDARAKELESENFTLRKRLGAAAAVGLGATLGPGAALASARPLRDWAQSGGSMAHTPAPQAGQPRAPASQPEEPALAPSEAEALAIVRAREVANRKAMERDVGAYTEDQARGANERQQLAAEPGSGGRLAQVGRIASDERTKMYPSDEDAKMQFPAGVEKTVFRYTPEAQAQFGLDNDLNVGLTAQQLEKSPEGATVVEEDPQTGMKMVDTPKLTMLATAKLSEMEKRLKKLEGSSGKRS